MIVKIKRQERDNTPAYWQSFEYTGSKDMTVAAMLDVLNYKDDLFDVEGNPARRIRWECSCMQKLCGACAMVINHEPALACHTFLSSIKGSQLILEPLSKFPVISDLIVDRSIIETNLKKAKIYLHGYRGSDKKENPHQYVVSKCLKCGLCLEVCPNYVNGEQFFGALFANHSYLMISQSKEGKEMRVQYDKHFAQGCSKALSCERVCPVGIPTLASISKLNSG